MNPGTAILSRTNFLVLYACRSLSPGDTISDAVVAPLKGIGDKALLVYRFDRLLSGARIHFEEFNQLLGHRSGDDKYIGHRHKAPGCAPADTWRLYERVLVCLLTENTDVHLKNFAMLHTPAGRASAWPMISSQPRSIRIPHLRAFD
jgi:serine/threonine-protein kinase HipA